MAETYSGISDLDSISSVSSGDLIEVAKKNGALYDGKKIDVANLGLLPSVSSSDSGKFLVVDSNGNWVATTISAWNGGNF